MSRFTTKYKPYYTARIIRRYIQSVEDFKPNRKQIRSIIKVIRRLGCQRLLNVYQVCDGMVGISYEFIFIGVENDGYAHS